MKVITIDGRYIDNLPRLEKPVRIHQIVDLAKKFRWTVRVHGAHNE